VKPLTGEPNAAPKKERTWVPDGVTLGLPEAMKYKGPGATPEGHLPGRRGTDILNPTSPDRMTGETPQEFQARVDKLLASVRADTPDTQGKPAPPEASPARLVSTSAPSSGGGSGTSSIKQTYADLDRSNEGLIGSVLNARDATLRKGDTAEKYLGEGAQHIQSAIDDSKRIQAERDVAMKVAADSYKAQIQAQQQRIEKLEAPKDYWEDKGIASRMAIGIAQALGAFGSGLTKGPNAALDMLKQNIEHHADSQKAKFNAELTKIKNLNEFTDKKWAKDQYLDKRRDEEIAMGWQVAKAQLQRTAAMSDSAQAKDNAVIEAAKIDQVLAGLEEKGIKTRFEAQMKLAAGQGGGNNIRAQYQKYADAQLGKGETPLGLEQWAVQSGRAQMVDKDGRPVAMGGPSGGTKVYDSLDAVPKKQQDQAVHIGGGKFALASSSGVAKELTNQMGAINAVAKGMDELIDMRKKYAVISKDGGVVDPTIVKQMRGKAALLKYDVGQAHKMGVMASHETKDALEAIGEDPTAFNAPWRADPTKVMQGARDNLRNKANAYLEGAGIIVPGSNQAPGALPGEGKRIK
jgi:hypothetical protein